MKYQENMIASLKYSLKCILYYQLNHGYSLGVSNRQLVSTRILDLMWPSNRGRMEFRLRTQHDKINVVQILGSSTHNVSHTNSQTLLTGWTHNKQDTQESKETHVQTVVLFSLTLIKSFDININNCLAYQTYFNDCHEEEGDVVMIDDW